MSNQRTVIVVPCYNESKRFDSAAFGLALDTHESLHILFVNDGSTDPTQETLLRFQDRHDERVEIFKLDQNAGKAEAVRRGLLKSLEDLRQWQPYYVGYWDCDLATPLTAVRDFERYLDANNETSVLLGSRVRRLGARIDRSTIRHISGRMFATCASLVLDLPVYDTQCGAKLFRVGNYLTDALAQPFVSRWAFDVELIGRVSASLGENALAEYPLTQWKDVSGSKLSFKASIAALFSLFRLRRQNFLKASASKHPRDLPTVAPKQPHFDYVKQSKHVPVAQEEQ